MSVSSAAPRQLTREDPPVVSHPSPWDCAHASEGPEVLSSSSVGPVATQAPSSFHSSLNFPAPSRWPQALVDGTCVSLAVTFLPDIPQPCLTDSHSSRSAQPNSGHPAPCSVLSETCPESPTTGCPSPSPSQPFHRGAWVLDTPAHSWAAAVTQPRPRRTLHRQESSRLPVQPQRPVQVRWGDAAAAMLLGLSLPVWAQIHMTFVCHSVSGTHGARCPAGPACTDSVPRARV